MATPTVRIKDPNQGYWEDAPTPDYGSYASGALGGLARYLGMDEGSLQSLMQALLMGGAGIERPGVYSGGTLPGGWSFGSDSEPFEALTPTEILEKKGQGDMDAGWERIIAAPAQKYYDWVAKDFPEIFNAQRQASIGQFGEVSPDSNAIDQVLFARHIAPLITGARTQALNSFVPGLQAAANAENSQMAWNAQYNAQKPLQVLSMLMQPTSLMSQAGSRSQWVPPKPPPAQAAPQGFSPMPGFGSGVPQAAKLDTELGGNYTDSNGILKDWQGRPIYDYGDGKAPKGATSPPPSYWGYTGSNTSGAPQGGLPSWGLSGAQQGHLGSYLGGG